MELADVVRSYGGQAGLAKALGCDKSYLNRACTGSRPLGRALAIRIYRQTGHRVGPIEGASDAEIDMMERLIPQKQRAA